MNKQTIISTIVILVVVVAGLIVLQMQSNKPGKYDELATCINDSGAKFYGAFWCPHCADQKALFKGSEELLPYVECSLPDASGVTPICLEKEITGYPTWEFPDGSRLSTVQSLETLATKTNCSLPVDGEPVSTEGVGESSPVI